MLVEVAGGHDEQLLCSRVVVLHRIDLRLPLCAGAANPPRTAEAACYNFKFIVQKVLSRRSKPRRCVPADSALRDHRLEQSRHSNISMKCPFCGFENDKVVDSRESKEAESIRRRRECLKCGKRFTTYERIDEIPYMVVKKDGRREKFDRQKVLNGLLRACEKRPVPISKLEQIVNEAESFVIESQERERKTSEIGELIMNRLRRYDKVAYVRFASVYLDFKDVKEFMDELRDLVKAKEAPEARAKKGG